MINSFKRVIRHILLYTLKYTPVAGWVVQEACNRKVLRNPRSLKFIPDIFKTQEMCNKAVGKDSCTLRFVSFQLWMHDMSNKAIEKYIYPMMFNTQEMCENVVENDPYTLKFVPDHFNTEEICDKAVRDDPSSLQIGLLKVSRYKCGMIRVNIVIIFLSGTMVIKNRRLKKPQ